MHRPELNSSEHQCTDRKLLKAEVREVEGKGGIAEEGRYFYKREVRYFGIVLTRVALEPLLAEPLLLH